jgi:hypothetical protein
VGLLLRFDILGVLSGPVFLRLSFSATLSFFLELSFLAPGGAYTFIFIMETKKMKVIMLLGPSNKGKTTTMNLLYDELARYEENIVCPKSQLGGNPKDFECILKYDGKLVALYSMGDFSTCIIPAISAYEEKKCDVLVYTCNDKFTRPKERIKKYPGSVIIPKSIGDNCEDRDMKNHVDKNKLIAHILLNETS